jgi:uncharacterized protein (TIGR02145 family)
MKSIFLIFYLLIIGFSYSQTTGTLKDARDGKVYKTVVIGNQTWMAENLNVSTFRNGDFIPEAKTNEEWKSACKNEQPAWCYYEFKKLNGEKFGKLYNWFAVNDPRGLSPEGWHIPNKKKWEILINTLGGLNHAGKKMKSPLYWIDNLQSKGKNQSGFAAIPSGNYNIDFDWINYGFYCWSRETTKVKPEMNFVNAAHLLLLNIESGVALSVSWENMHTSSGFSVRCIRD